MLIKFVNNFKELKFKETFLFFFFIKLLYTIYAVFIFGKISTISDTESYLGTTIFFTFEIFKSNTLFMMFITSVLKYFLRLDILVHFSFTLLSFYSLVKLIKRVTIGNANGSYILIFFFLMPSFGMWTSTIVKEAISCFLRTNMDILVLENWVLKRL